MLFLLGQGEIEEEDVLFAVGKAEEKERDLIDVLIASNRVEADAVSRAIERTNLWREETVRVVIADTEQRSERLRAEMDPSLRPSITGSPRERYHDIKLLGRGGMANVTLAYDDILNREVALKEVRTNPNLPNAGELLLTEARITGLLDHPGIVPVYDVGGDEFGVSFYTMRALMQPSLADQMCDDTLNTMTLEEAVTAIRQVCLTVQFAHDRGVVHRDLKPANILLGDYGEIYVVDWGVARVVDETLGITHPLEERRGVIVGTLQYMSPEQARGDIDKIDTRSDVYGLGGILYFVLTGTPPYLEEHLLALREAVLTQELDPVEVRAPGRNIPKELSEICLKALEKDPERRYQSAKEMASELGSYLAGEKRRSRALEVVNREIAKGRASQRKWMTLRQQSAELGSECRKLEFQLPAWAPAEEKALLWAMQSEMDHLEIEAERAFTEATRHLSQALAQGVPAPEASRTLGDMYWLRLEEAEAHNRTAECIAWEGRILQYGDEESRSRLSAVGRIVAKSAEPDLSINLARFKEVGRRLVPETFIAKRPLPQDMDNVKPGSHLLLVTGAEGQSVRVPIVVSRGEALTLELSMPAADSIPEGFTFIPGGEFRLGQSPTPQRPEVNAFAIMTHPVTCQDYLDFLNDVRLSAPEGASLHAPRIHEDAPSYFDQDSEGAYQLPDKDPEGDAWHPGWPIIMVNYGDCLAYAAWRSERDGRQYRLPTSLEWQKAARGVDGRPYPWGYHFDATFCCMRDSARGRSMPAPVGTFEADCSPYGVRDMAGTVVEWTSTLKSDTQDDAEDQGIPIRILEGAAYNSAPFVCSLNFNMSSPETFRHGHYGFRLAIDVQT